MLRSSILAVVAFAIGCSSTGVRVTASSRSTTSLGDINWEEYKLPVFSTYSGPAVVVWANKDYLDIRKITASGSVTNDVEFLSIYTSKEDKNSSVEIEFADVAEKNPER